MSLSEDVPTPFSSNEDVTASVPVVAVTFVAFSDIVYLMTLEEKDENMVLARPTKLIIFIRYGFKT